MGGRGRTPGTGSTSTSHPVIRVRGGPWALEGLKQDPDPDARVQEGHRSSWWAASTVWARGVAGTGPLDNVLEEMPSRARQAPVGWYSLRPNHVD